MIPVYEEKGMEGNKEESILFIRLDEITGEDNYQTAVYHRIGWMEQSPGRILSTYGAIFLYRTMAMVMTISTSTLRLSSMQ